MNAGPVLSPKLDYCKSLFIDIPDFFITKLKCVKIATAMIVLNITKYNSISPYLHLLPDLIVFKGVNSDASDYIQSLLSIGQSPRPLCSGNKMYK